MGRGKRVAARRAAAVRPERFEAFRERLTDFQERRRYERFVYALEQGWVEQVLRCAWCDDLLVGERHPDQPDLWVAPEALDGLLQGVEVSHGICQACLRDMREGRAGS